MAVRRTHSATSPIPASVEHTVKDILGRFDHVDYLVNNARPVDTPSLVNSTDRLHDHEAGDGESLRLGAVRMVLTLLPATARAPVPAVVNVSSAGVQARNQVQLVSAHLAALDTFADAVASRHCPTITFATSMRW